MLWLQIFTLEFYKRQLLPSAVNLCKQFGPRAGPTECLSWSRSKQLDTESSDNVSERFFRKILILKKISSMKNYPGKGKNISLICSFFRTTIIVWRYIYMRVRTGLKISNRFRAKKKWTEIAKNMFQRTMGDEMLKKYILLNRQVFFCCLNGCFIVWITSYLWCKSVWF